MKNEIIELTEKELAAVTGGDSATWVGIGLGAVAIGLGVLCAPVAATGLVAWTAFSLAIGGDIAFGYGLATMRS